MLFIGAEGEIYSVCAGGNLHGGRYFFVRKSSGVIVKEWNKIRDSRAEKLGRMENYE